MTINQQIYPRFLQIIDYKNSTKHDFNIVDKTSKTVRLFWQVRMQSIAARPIHRTMTKYMFINVIDGDNDTYSRMWPLDPI